jgi:hypothetical protein
MSRAETLLYVNFKSEKFAIISESNRIYASIKAVRVHTRRPMLCRSFSETRYLFSRQRERAKKKKMVKLSL